MIYEAVLGEWKRPKKAQMLPGVKARVQHVFSIAGPSPEIGYIEGELQIRGKKQVIFVSHKPPGIEFQIDSVNQVEIWLEEVAGND